MADSTTNVGLPLSVINSATCFILSGDPTEVPPNFITIIVFAVFMVFI